MFNEKKDEIEAVINNEEAIQYFNSEAAELVLLLSEMKETSRKGRALRSVEEEDGSSFHENEVKYSMTRQVDHEGNEISRHFYIEPGKWIGLDILNYREAKKVIDNLYKRREVREIISKETLIKILFKWLDLNYCEDDQKSPKFVEYLNNAIKENVEDLKISIPISYLAIDNGFNLGKVRFEFLKKELFDLIENKLREGAEREKLSEEEFENIISKLRKDYQGKVVGTINIIAEEQKAVEFAEREVERTIMALKFYSSFAFIPRQTATFGRKGIAHLPTRYIFIFPNAIPTLHEGIIGNQNINFNIDHNILQKMKDAGIEKLAGILQKSDISEFEELIITAIHTFTRAISYFGFHEKLVFILSASEIIFLKDSNEPIQYSLGQRLGFFITQNPQERKDVVSLVNKAYKIRSNFVHHGKEKEDYEILQKLLISVWKAINLLIRNHDKFKTKQEFLLFVENIIYA